jgi:hypothetical protein
LSSAREAEAEESQLLEAVAGEYLVKTYQAGKRLSGCCDGLRVLEISDGVLSQDPF